jgi:YVTN family beta-propeller protein
MKKGLFVICSGIILVLSCAKKKEAKCDYIGPADHAYEFAGPVDGGYVLPNGHLITPEGVIVEVGQFPMNAIEVPGKNILIVSNNGSDDQSLSVIDTTTNTLKQTITVPSPVTDYNLFLGLAVTTDGSTLYASGGGENKVHIFTINPDGTLAYSNAISIAKFPGGLTLSPDNNTLYVALMQEAALGIIDLTQNPPTVSKVPVGSRTNSLPFPYPFWVTLSKDASRAYVSNWGDMSVSVVDPVSKTENSRISVGKNPEGMALSPDGSFLYVVNSDHDTISVIDTSTDTVVKTISLTFESDSYLGSSPLSVDVSSDGAKLYVASAGTNSIDVISTSDGSIIGRIPTAWYPVRAIVSSDETKLYVLNAKGLYGGPNPDKDSVKRIMRGNLEIIQLSDVISNFSYLTEKVTTNNTRLSSYYELPCKNLNSPVPAEPGRESPIKHVIFIVKENKTYDQVLGDLPGTDADPSLVEYGEKFTPNTHKLAQEFTNFDNCYSDAEVSMQGHMWDTGSNCNDFVERGWVMNTLNETAAGVEPAGHMGNEFFFHNLLNNNIKFMVYGEAVGILSELWGLFEMEIKFKGYDDESWPGGVIWSMSVKDEERAKYFADRLKEWEDENSMPQYIMMLLPDDHTYGVSPGTPTPESMVSDNDYGLGLVIEALSHSKFWKETAVFVTEDDPQSGRDHIEGHRTICLVISPYARRGYTSHVHYSVPSIYKTMELILGVKPMYKYDDHAPAMYDVFTTEPDFTPYDAVPPQVPYEITPSYEELPAEIKKLADMSRKMDFSEPDSIKNHALGYVNRHYMELKHRAR